MKVLSPARAGNPKPEIEDPELDAQEVPADRTNVEAPRFGKERGKGFTAGAPHSKCCMNQQ